MLTWTCPHLTAIFHHWPCCYLPHDQSCHNIFLPLSELCPRTKAYRLSAFPNRCFTWLKPFACRLIHTPRNLYSKAKTNGFFMSCIFFHVAQRIIDYLRICNFNVPAPPYPTPCLILKMLQVSSMNTLSTSHKPCMVYEQQVRAAAVVWRATMRSRGVAKRVLFFFHKFVPWRIIGCKNYSNLRPSKRLSGYLTYSFQPYWKEWIKM